MATRCPANWEIDLQRGICGSDKGVERVGVYRLMQRREVQWVHTRRVCNRHIHVKLNLRSHWH
jgi:hypothetical protein